MSYQNSRQVETPRLRLRLQESLDTLESVGVVASEELKIENSNSCFMAVPKVSVVIPALNEARNLNHVLPRLPSWVHEVILIDGHSTDGTVEIARNLLPEICILEQKGNGKGDALRSGFDAATGDIIVMLDADGSTDPEEIPAFIGALLAGADYVKGSRFLQGGGTDDMGWLRRLGNFFFLALIRSIFGGQYSDLCFGYNAFWKRILPEMYLNCDGFEIETEMNLRALRGGFRIAEVPCFEARRIHGKSNLRTFPDGWRVLKTILREALGYLKENWQSRWVPEAKAN